MENIKLDTYVVKSGDTLMKIAKEQLGDANRYMEIVNLNNISDPDIINPGEKFKLPSATSQTVETLDLIDEEISTENLTNKETKSAVGTAGIENSTIEKISKYSIKPRSRIDEMEGERDKRVQYLTNGYTGSDVPSESELASLMTTINIPIWNGKEVTSRTLTVNKKLASSIQSIFTELAEKKYEIEFAQELDGGRGNYEVEGYEYRTTGSGRLSDHAYGGAIDINAVHNPMTGPRDALKENDGSKYVVTDEVIKIFAKHGFYWGGDWHSSCDPMHFSFTGW